ncbi:hypothetical protein DH86_00004310, partial [Scytalidium sp. 3C]
MVEPTVIQPLAVSEYTASHASPFARTCQASHILSHILRHLNEEHEDIQLKYQEAMQLHQTIDAFSSALSYEIDNISNGD